MTEAQRRRLALREAAREALAAWEVEVATKPSPELIQAMRNLRAALDHDGQP
jgi:hypothetical protein